jgi:hypothetical protein
MGTLLSLQIANGRLLQLVTTNQWKKVYDLDGVPRHVNSLFSCSTLT